MSDRSNRNNNRSEKGISVNFIIIIIISSQQNAITYSTAVQVVLLISIAITIANKHVLSLELFPEAVC